LAVAEADFIDFSFASAKDPSVASLLGMTVAIRLRDEPQKPKR